MSTPEPLHYDPTTGLHLPRSFFKDRRKRVTREVSKVRVRMRLKDCDHIQTTVNPSPEIINLADAIRQGARGVAWMRCHTAPCEGQERAIEAAWIETVTRKVKEIVDEA
jgi:hypothetical protein